MIYRLHRACCMLLSVMTALCFLMISPAQTTYAAGSGSRPEVRVAVWNRGGRFDHGDDGSLTGYDSDLVNRLADYLDIAIQYVPVSGPAEAIEKLDAGDLDLITSMRPTPEREQKYLFSGLAVGFTYSGLIALSTNDTLMFGDPESYKDCTVGYEGGSGSQAGVLAYLNHTCHVTHPIPYDSIDALRKALHDGTIDIMATGANNVSDGEKIISRFAPQEVYFMTSREHFALMEQVNKFLTDLNINAPDYLSSLQEQYFPMYTTTEFTKAEAEYIASHGTIRVGMPESRCPVSYLDPDTGQLTGIAVDLMNLIQQTSGLSFSYVPIPEGMTVGKALQNTSYDIVFPSTDASHYKGALALYISAPLLDTSVIIATSNIDQLVGKSSLRLGIAQDIKGLGSLLLEKYPQHTVTLYSDQDAALRALRSGEIDAIINNVYVWSYLMQNPDYRDLTISPSVASSINQCIAGDRSRTDALLFDILDKSIRQIRTEDMDSIIVKYSNSRLYHYTVSDYMYIYRQMILVVSAVLFCLILGAWLMLRQKNRYYKHVAATNEKLVRANNTKTDFLSRMSHDIRTPMNAIIGMAALGKQETSDPHSLEYFNKIHASGHYLLGLINDILDMQHIESGEITLHNSIAFMPHMLDNILDVIKPLLEERNMNLDLDIQAVKPVYVVSDPLRFQQLHVNILTNSVRFSAPGSCIRWHITDYQVQCGRLYIQETIQDYGCGMSRDFIPKAFLPFEQEMNEYSYEQPGTGLGLTICHSIMQQMNGAIEVDSNLGKGTVVTLRYSLPVDHIEEPDSRQAEQTAHASTSDTSAALPPAASPYTCLAGRHVLMFEDHPLNTEIARRLLEKQHLIVHCATNGQIGIDMFLASAVNFYDIILMDIKMPVMDGLEATRRIRALNRPDAPAIPIIALTANAYEQDRQNCLDAGMNEHLAKPINPSVLYATLARFLGT